MILDHFGNINLITKIIIYYVQRLSFQISLVWIDKMLQCTMPKGDD
jgi:hypothetical protein